MNKLLEILAICQPSAIQLMLGYMRLQLPANFVRIYGVEPNEYVAAALLAVNTRGE